MRKQIQTTKQVAEILNRCGYAHHLFGDAELEAGTAGSFLHAGLALSFESYGDEAFLYLHCASAFGWPRAEVEAALREAGLETVEDYGPGLGIIEIPVATDLRGRRFYGADRCLVEDLDDPTDQLLALTSFVWGE